MSKRAKAEAQKNEIKQRLTALGVPFTEPTEHQIKVFDINYYPTKGKIYVDGEIASRDEKGIDAFINLLDKQGYIKKADNVFLLTQ